MDRFSTAMWDFSWATRRSGNEAEYADWDKVLDQLAERGYDNVRIDAFPHLVAAGRDGSETRDFLLLPQRKRFMWGNHESIEMSPRRDLIDFLKKCSERDITAGLSSWFIPDSTGRQNQVCTPEDYARIWDETLVCIRDADLLGTIKWVDLCNEFPIDFWAPGAANHIFGHSFSTPLGVGLRGLPWRKHWAVRTQEYLTTAIARLKKKWPTLKFCFSFCELAGPSLRALDVSEFDVAEVHCWLTDSIPWSMSNLQIAALLELPFGTELHAKRMTPTPTRKLENWLDTILTPKMTVWSNWASENSLPLIMTEGWGPTNYCDLPSIDGEWTWVQKFAEIAVHKSIQLGWTGICTSNFCQPHHKGMWADAAWHQELTKEIKTATRTSA